MKHHNFRIKKEAGFALLMTLIVVGVVLSVGLSILDLSIKQVRLSTNAKDSEIAFHAANAGLECARYWRREGSAEMEDGLAVNNVECFGVNIGSVSADASPDLDIDSINDNDGEAYLYDYEFTWGPNGDRCTNISTLVMVAELTGDGATTTNMDTLFDGFPDGNTSYCEPGGRCTTVSVRGYNRACTTVSGSYGVVEREVLLQF